MQPNRLSALPLSPSQKLLLLKFDCDCLTSGVLAVGECQNNKTKKTKRNNLDSLSLSIMHPRSVSGRSFLIVADDSFRLVCHDCSASTPSALQTPPEDLRRPSESCSSFRGRVAVVVGGAARQLSALVSICQPMGKARGRRGLCVVYLFIHLFLSFHLWILLLA